MTNGIRLNPYILQATKDWNPTMSLTVESSSIPEENHTLCDLGFAVKITGQETFPLTILIYHMFLYNIWNQFKFLSAFFIGILILARLQPIWVSGINTAFKYIWAKIRRSGIACVPLGLPRDKSSSRDDKNHGISTFFYSIPIFIEEKKTILKNAITLFTSSNDNSVLDWRRNLA